VPVILRQNHISLPVILTAALILFSTCPVSGGPAQLEPVTVRQPDGTPLTIRILGDERFLVTETLDGYTVTRDAKTDEWRYALCNADGKLVPSELVAGKHDPGKNGLAKHIRPSKKVIDAQVAARKKNEIKPIVRGKRKNNSSKPTSSPGGPSAAPGGPSAAPPLPSTFTEARILVILADFSGGPQFPYNSSKTDFETRVFSEGSYPSGSVDDLFAEASYGQFDLNGSVVDWTTAPETYAYYCDGSSGMGSFPNNSQGLARDLCLAIDGSVDFSQFDADNDGEVDGVVVIFEGEADGSSSRFWPHMWGLNSEAITLDGKTIDRYCISNEQRTDGTITTIGVICHELGHVFGSPDLYDYTPNTSDYENDGDNNAFPVAHWCLMARGGNNGPSGSGGSRPSHPCAFIKAQFFGWISPQTIDTSGSYNIEAFQTAPAGARSYQVPLTADGDEYLLIANRGQNVSSFDYNSWNGSFRNSGIVVMHIDWHSDAGGLGNSVSNDGPAAYSYYAVWVEDHAHPSPIDQWPYELKLDAALSVEGGCTSLGPTGTVWASAASNHDGFSPVRIYNASSRGATMSFDMEYLKLGTTMPSGDVGYFYDQPVPVSGNSTAVTCTITSGSTPAGLVLDGTGCVISGTPSGAPGNSTFTIRAESNGLVNFANVTIAIADPVQITGFTIPANWPIGQPGFLGQVDTQDGAKPLFFDLVNAAELPPGLALDNAAGSITGTPTAVGGYAPEFVVTDAAGVQDSGVCNITIDPPSIVAPPVTGLTWSRNGATVTLSWDESAAVTFSSYVIYREDFSFSDVSALSPIASVGPISTVQYDDIPPGDYDYYYAVAVLDNVGYINPTVIPVGPVDVYPPLEVTGLTATQGNNNNVILSWTASASADVAGYTVAWDDGGGYGSPVDVGATIGTDINGLDEEASYTFRVSAYDEVPNVSPGATVASSPLDVIPPADVSAFVAKPGFGAVRLIWLPSTSPDAAGYRVAVDNGSGFGAPTDVGKALEYTPTGLQALIKYSFRVTVYDEIPNESAGATVNAMPLLYLKKKKRHCGLGAVDDDPNSIIGALLPVLICMSMLLLSRRRRWIEDRV